MREMLVSLLIALLLTGLALAAPAPDVETTPSPSIPGPAIIPSTGNTCPPTPGGCPGCDEISGAPDSNMFLEQDDVGHTIIVTVFYENVTSPPPTRKPLNFSTVVVRIYNESFSDTYRLITDADGRATLDFSKYAGGCANFIFLYSPFTCENSSLCGFQQTLNASGLFCPPCNASEIEWLNGEAPVIPPLCYNVKPIFRQTTYCPPPPPLTATPAICLPIILIFALLGGALFMTGKNPFAGFDMSAPRISARVSGGFQARSRGVGIDLLSAAKQLSAGIKGEKQAAADKKAAAKAAAERGEAGKGAVKGVKGKEGMVPQMVGGKGAVSRGGAFWQRPKMTMAQIKEATRPSSELAASMKGVGFFKGLAIAAGAVVGGLIGNTIFAPLFAKGVPFTGKVGELLDRLAKVYPDNKAAIIANNPALMKQLAEMGVKNPQMLWNKGPIEMEIGGKKVTVEIVNVNPDTLKAGVGGLEAQLKITTPEGMMNVTFSGGNVTAKDSFGVKYDMTDGTFKPVSIEISGGKEMPITDLGKGQYGFSYEGKSYTMASEQGAPVIRDVDTGQPASLVGKLGIDPTIALENRDKPAPISLHDTEQIAAIISANAKQEITFTSGEIVKQFGDGQPVKVTDVNLAGRDTKPDEVVKIVTNSSGTEFNFNKDNQLIGAVDRYGTSPPIEGSAIKGTELKMGKRYENVGETYDAAKMVSDQLKQNDSMYREEIVKPAYAAAVEWRKDNPDFKANEKLFESELKKPSPLIDPADSAAKAEAAGRAVMLASTLGAPDNPELKKAYELAAKGDSYGADQAMKKYFEELGAKKKPKS